MSAERMTVAGIDLEVLRRGAGPPLVYLHGMETLDPRAPFLDLLARRRTVIAPSSPGFGASPRPAEFETVYDLVQLHLALIDALPAGKVTLVGHSFGGWLAAEIAVACSHRLDRLVLIDAFGIKLGDRETADIFDVFNASPDEVRRRSWHDPGRFAPDFDALPDAEIIAYARGRDALCLYGWQPYMYNPRLARWLRRIAVPTLVLWGDSDGIVAPDYGRAYSRLIPGVRFELVEHAGHSPQIEQPEVVAGHIAQFLGEA
jgi:pimeloyl-ACP methyl ester carboxylesterase